jgi:hypothetical protein
MKKTFTAILMALTITGCEHVNFEFDWGMLAKSVWHQLQK